MMIANNRERKLLQYNILLSILAERYERCNEDNHLKPNIKEGICNYCYRDLDNRSLQILQGLAKLADELHLI